MLGGFIVGVMIIGYFYGCDKCVWCKYLCLVNGVFGLLVKLVLVYYKVNEDVWCVFYYFEYKIIFINCVLLVFLCNMKGVFDCYMCGCCSGYCDVIVLSFCLFVVEVVYFGKIYNNLWESVLVFYGLLGIVIGVFYWMVSFWFIVIK